MTLIAYTLNHERPFLVGDLIISSESANSSIQLLTNSIDITQYLDSGKAMPVELRQKLYIIRENICVALAGSVIDMKRFLEALTLRCSVYDVVDESHIHSFIQEYTDESLGNLAFVIISVTKTSSGKLKMGFFRFPEKSWSYTLSAIFEGAYACGSGKEGFLNEISAEMDFDASAVKGDIKRAISFNISFIARLLATERVSLFTVNKYWGGGFETILYDGQKFMKLDQIAYVVMQGQFGESGDVGIPVPTLVMYVEYYNDYLIICSFELKKCKREDFDNKVVIHCSDFEKFIHVVHRIDFISGVSDEELPSDFSFDTQRVAIGYAINTNDGGIIVPSLFYEGGLESVKFVNNEIEIVLSTVFLNKVRGGLKSVYENKLKRNPK